MAIIDIEYNKLLKKITEEGYVNFDKSRNIGTKQISSYYLDLRNKLTLPILTTKKIFLNSVLAELNMFFKGNSNIKELIDNNCNIWNKDAYNYYIKKCDKSKINSKLGYDAFVYSIKNQKTMYNLVLPDDYNLGDLGNVYGVQWHKDNQLKNVIDNLIRRNFNRRLIVNAWNVKELDDMALPPCHWSFEILQEKDGFVLKWHQRSVDTFLGLPFNIISYHILGILFSVITAVPFYGVIGDLSNVHIYENHLDQVKEQLSRSPYEYGSRDTKLLVNNSLFRTSALYREDKISFEELLNNFDISSIKIVGYESYPALKADMVAPI